MILNKTRDFRLNNLYEKLNILTVTTFLKHFLVKNNLIKLISFNFNTICKY